MAEDKPERKYVCTECGIAYAQKITADACGGVDRQLANGRAIGL